MEAITLRSYLVLIFFLKANNTDKVLSPQTACGCLITEIINHGYHIVGLQKVICTDLRKN